MLLLPFLLFAAEAPTGTHVMDDVAVVADEPRFVAPTRRDRIGRIWAPVEINGQGPFRLVLATGASHSALTPRLAHTLGLKMDVDNLVNPIDKLSAQILLDPASEFRFDGSDQMPAAVGSGAFWTESTSWITGQ